MALYVGQKVVCVDAKDSAGRHKQLLVEGAVYKLRWVGMHVHPDYPLEFCVRLVGIDRSGYGVPRGHDTPYKASRFRPVVEDADKLEWARQLVAPKAKDRELVS
jgi:hypothetical protein